MAARFQIGDEVRTPEGVGKIAWRFKGSPTPGEDTYTVEVLPERPHKVYYEHEIVELNPPAVQIKVTALKRRLAW
jgi:hypothetical protein